MFTGFADSSIIGLQFNSLFTQDFGQSNGIYREPVNGENSQRN